MYREMLANGEYNSWPEYCSYSTFAEQEQAEEDAYEEYMEECRQKAFDEITKELKEIQKKSHQYPYYLEIGTEFKIKGLNLHACIVGKDSDHKYMRIFGKQKEKDFVIDPYYRMQKGNDLYKIKTWHHSYEFYDEFLDYYGYKKDKGNIYHKTITHKNLDLVIEAKVDIVSSTCILETNYNTLNKVFASDSFNFVDFIDQEKKLLFDIEAEEEVQRVFGLSNDASNIFDFDR